MAKATLVPPVPVKQNVLLELSREEAQLLRDMLGSHIEGQSRGRRELSNSIFNALTDAGLSIVDRIDDLSGSLYFKVAK